MKKLFYFILISVCLFSCENISSVQEDFASTSADNPELSGENLRIFNNPPIPSYALNWETVYNLPHPNLTIRAPWQIGSSIRISNDILYDYKKVDGWELAYSTFSSTYAENPLFFVLYNKFRGLLRVYYYSKNDISTTFSDYLVGNLTLMGSQYTSSPVLNFASQSVINVNEKQLFAANLIPFKAAAYTWYAFEYELAYDPNMASRFYTQLSAVLEIDGVNVTNVNLDGESSTVLDGGTFSNSSSLNINPNFSSSNTVYNNSVIVNGNTDADKLKIGSILKNGIKSALTSGLAGLAKNILSGLFTKTSSNSNVSKMMIDVNSTLTGTFEDDLGIQYPHLAFTGTQSPIGNGTYSSPQGVFNLSNNPTIKVKKIHQRRINQYGEEIEPDIYYSYEVIPSSVNFIWNPAVIPSLGSVSNLKYEVILRDINQPVTFTSGTKEKSGSLAIVAGQLIKNNFYQQESIGVRISYKFTPSNGSNPVYNVKTFTATEQLENVYLPPVGGGGEDS